MIAQLKNNKNSPGFSKDLENLFARFGKKARSRKVNIRKILGKRRSDWWELVK